MALSKIAPMALSKLLGSTGSSGGVFGYTQRHVNAIALGT